MFSKHRKLLPWLCWIFAALCLSVGSVMLQFYSDTEQNFGDETGTQRAENTTLEPLEETDLITTALPDTSSETALPDLSSQHNIERYPAQRFGSLILLVAGSALAICFVFLFRQNLLLLGPESNLFLFLLAFFVLLWQPVREQYLQVLICFGAWLLILIVLRGFWAWLWRKLPLNSTDAHRLGMLLSFGKWNRYFIFQFCWSVLLLSCCAGVLVYSGGSLRSLILAAVCLFSAAQSIRCWICLAYDTEHLIQQIRNLQQDGQVTVRTGMFEDVEEGLSNLQSQRNAAVQAAVANERFKVELISNVSHDLRTPLSAILGYGELLEQEKLSPAGKEQLERLNQKAGYMRELVDSLFELTKVSSGTAESRREEIDLIRLLEQTLGLFDDRLQERNLKICRHYPTQKIPVITDGARMHQVFANLIGNAVKYTLQGTRIHLEVRDEASEYTVRITNIASYEMDFSPEEILQRFARGDKMRSTEGSGIGLAIAQTYTESVGGRFAVSIDGEQFSATVILPKTERNL